ncbi:hypothetical protein HDU92_000163, partial [Lobulomyces angularis]
MASALPKDMREELRKAGRIIEDFIKPTKKAGNNPDQLIPPDIIKNAKGIAILSVIKAGFIWSGRAGSGLIVARLEGGGWSAPSGIGTAGMGFGGQIGAELTNFVIVLNTADAVKAFSHGGNVTLGGNLSVAAGPIGRSAEASGSVRNFAAVFSYSKSQGLFAGISIEGSAIFERKDANELFYKKKISAKEILKMTGDQIPEARSLYEALNERSELSDSYSSSSLERNNRIDDNYRSDSDRDYRRNESDRDYRRNESDRDYRRSDSDRDYRRSDYESDRNFGRSEANRNRVSSYSQDEHSQKSSYIRPTDDRKNDDRSRNNSYSRLNEEKYTTSERDSYHSENSYSKPKPPAPPAKSWKSEASTQQNQVRDNNPFTDRLKNFETSQPSFPKAAPPPPPKRNNNTGVALYDFAGQQHGDLPFNKGDIIVILKSSDSQDDWWTGSCKGREGI